MRSYLVLLMGVYLMWAQPVAARSLAAIKQSGQLRICIAPLAYFVYSAPPGCKADCTYSGPSVDLSLRFADYVGKQIKAPLAATITMLPSFDDYFVNDQGATVADGSYTPKYLADGSCDVYAESLAVRDWRLKKLHIMSYMPGRMMVIGHQGSVASLKALADLAGRSTIAEENTIYAQWINEMNKTMFKSTPIAVRTVKSGGAEKLDSLEAGKIDFAVIDVGTALQLTNPKLSPFKNIVPLFPVGPTSWGGWGFRKQDKSLHRFAQQFFEEQVAQKDQGINMVFRKYYGVTHAEYLNILTSVIGDKKAP